MQLQFGDEELERLAYEPASTADGWSASRTRRYRQVVQMIACATGAGDLTALVGLRAQPVPGGLTLRLDDGHRLRVGLPERAAHPTAIIEAVEAH